MTMQVVDVYEFLAPQVAFRPSMTNLIDFERNGRRKLSLGRFVPTKSKA